MSRVSNNSILQLTGVTANASTDTPIAFDERNGQLISFDGVGAHVLRCLATSISFDQLLAAIKLEFEGDGKIIETDLHAFIGLLLDKGFLKVIDEVP